MPITLTYPGVYVEELPSGVRTITGVATSITAFIGRALRGPVNEPVFINNFGDFDRVFGGLWVESSLGYAVRDFYLNGGSQAVIVRLFHPFYGTEDERTGALDAAQDASAAAQAVASGESAAAVAAAARGVANHSDNADEPRKSAADAVATAAETAATGGASNADTKAAAAKAAAGFSTKSTINANNLNLVAAYEGAWGNKLRARIDHDVNPGAADKADLFNLTVRDATTGQIEVFRNLSFRAGHTREVGRVLANESRLVRMTGTLGSRPAAHDAGAGKDIWADNSPETNDKVTTGAAENGGALVLEDFIGAGLEGRKLGLYSLLNTDLFNILCIPPYNETGDVDKDLLDDAAAFCEKKRAFLIIDPPSTWTTKDDAKGKYDADIGVYSRNAAIYFPRLRQPNILRDNQVEDFVPCGAVAGVMARTDASRGVWKAPAGTDARLVNVPELSVKLTDDENGELNPLAINCLRSFAGVGRVVWGARTGEGTDRNPSDWKYIPVRRTALFIEESLYRGTQWVVFEPNDEPLWSQIRLNLGAFMHNLFRQGAFQGTTPQEAYFVKCDKETTTQNDINLGIVNIVVGFAPLKPAEFVVIKIQQIAGKIET